MTEINRLASSPLPSTHASVQSGCTPRASAASTSKSRLPNGDDSDETRYLFPISQTYSNHESFDNEKLGPSRLCSNAQSTSCSVNLVKLEDNIAVNLKSNKPAPSCTLTNPSGRILRPKLPSTRYVDDYIIDSACSDMSSLSSLRACDSRIEDPDYEACFTESSKTFYKTRNKIQKKKRERRRSSAMSTREADNDQRAFSTTSSMYQTAHNIPDVTDSQTVDWVRAHYPVDGNNAAASSTTPERRTLVPATSSLTFATSPSNSEQPTASDKNRFKKPKLPASYPVYRHMKKNSQPRKTRRTKTAIETGHAHTPSRTVTPMETERTILEDVTASPTAGATPRPMPSRRLYNDTSSVGQCSDYASQPVPVEVGTAPVAQPSDVEQAARSVATVSSPALLSSLLPVEDGDNSNTTVSDQQPIQNDTTSTVSSYEASETFDAVVFRPTAEEFKDPIAYIKKKQALSSNCLCKIILPVEFTPSLMEENYKFSTNAQCLGRLYGRWLPNSREKTQIQIAALLDNHQEEDQLVQTPKFEGVELDLVKLYNVVSERGGVAELTSSADWARVADDMCLVSPEGTRMDPRELEMIYLKHVLPYASLSRTKREELRLKVLDICAERARSLVQRAARPLHDKRRLLGETTSEDDEEPPPERHADRRCFELNERGAGAGPVVSLATFRRMGAQLEAMRLHGQRARSAQELEEEYTRLVFLGNEHVCALTADLDAQPCFLQSLSEEPSNVLRALRMRPRVTLSQLFSTRCWHADPHHLAWLDCMREGASKIWYAVPQSEGDKFRDAVQELVPSAVLSARAWLAPGACMVPPGLLAARGVPCWRAVQAPGELVVVYPGAYSAAVSTGFSISENTYFENKSWLCNIYRVFKRMQVECVPPLFSSTLLLMRMASSRSLDPNALQQVYVSLQLQLADEFEDRREAARLECTIHLEQNERSPGGDAQNHEQCSVCRTPLTLSQMTLYGEPRSRMCLNHGLMVYNAGSRAGPPLVTLFYSDKQLRDILRAHERRSVHVASPRTSSSPLPRTVPGTADGTPLGVHYQSM